MTTVSDLEGKFDHTTLVDNVKAMATNVGNQYFDLGEALFYLKNSGLLTEQLGVDPAESKSSWKQFCTDNLSISYRTAQYWVSMYEYFRGFEVTKADLSNLGWTKAKELVKVADTREELLTLVTFASSHSLVELQELVKQLKNKNKAADLYTYKTFKFRLPNYQSDTVDAAIEVAKAELRTDNINDVIAAIFLDYLQAHSVEVATTTESV